MNILMITHHRRFKAAWRAGSMATSLVRRGHQVTLIVTSNDRRLGTKISISEGVRVIEAPDLLWGRLRSGWDLWDMLNRFLFLRRDDVEYHLVHCFETRPTTIYPALALVRGKKLPLLTDWNDWFGRGGLITLARPTWYRVLFTGMETHYEEAFRARAAGLTVISTALARRAAALGVPEDAICYIPGGVVPTEVPARSIEVCRARMGYPAGAPIIAFASADSHADLKIVMEALRIVRRAHPHVKLLMSGRVNKRAAELVTSHRLEEHVVFLGFMRADTLAWHMGAADLFVLPFPDTVYNRGRWPNKLGLYMCLGRPTVANPTGDVELLFNRHPIGMLAAAEPNDFAERILTLIETPALARELGANARFVASTELNWDRLVVALEGFYESVLARREHDDAGMAIHGNCFSFEN